MNRYVFRGKRADNKKWVEGHLAFEDVINVSRGMDTETGDGIWEEYEVIPETVGQSTGLTDKNGLNLLFEGDVVKLKIKEQEFVCEVKYSSRRMCYVFKYTHPQLNHISHDTMREEAYTGCWATGYKYSIEIIGNIHDACKRCRNVEISKDAKFCPICGLNLHDNPELLGGNE